MKKQKICQMCFEAEAMPNSNLCKECSDAMEDYLDENEILNDCCNDMGSLD